MKIFEIPDKNGKITYRVQTPDGVWHNTDKEGNFLPEAEEDAPREKDDSSHRSSPLKKRRGGEESRVPSNSKKTAIITLHFTMEDYELFSNYIRWRCLYREECSRSSFAAKLILEAIRKDKDFKAFKENRVAPQKETLNTLKILTPSE